jgi:opacity protein-like surface antigen
MDMTVKSTTLLSAVLVVFFSTGAAIAQKSAEEPVGSSTWIGGYGNARYVRDANEKTATVTLERFVLFVGHKFDASVSLLAELEIEDAKVSGGEPGGEVAIEQAYLKFDLSGNASVLAGLFEPRIGITNEDHLPSLFNGNERTIVETLVIPTTWRELGVGFTGSLSAIPLHISASIVTGLNSAAFVHGTGIREGRAEGRNAGGNNLAFTGALRYYGGPMTIQVSGYAGGSVGLAPRVADSLQLASGILGTPVVMGEADVQYESDGFGAKVLGTVLSIPDAADINRAYANNTPRRAYGFYAELGYDLFHALLPVEGKQLIAFARYEALDLNDGVASNGVRDATLNQRHVIAGLGYHPTPSVVIKADVRFVRTGDQNPALVITPGSVDPPYHNDNTILNLGIGFSF